MLKIGLIGCGHIAETYFKSQNYFNNINYCQEAKEKFKLNSRIKTEAN